MLVLLTFLLALPILSTDIYLPSLSEIAFFYNSSDFQVQLTLTGYFLVFGLSQLIYGSLSDRFGRRPILLFSLIIYNLASMICAVSSNIYVLIFGRCLQALGAGSAILIFAIVRDLYRGNQVAKMIAYMSAVVALSPIIAPIMGGVIQAYLNWQWNFGILTILGLTLLLLTYLFLPETNRRFRINTFLFQQVFKDYHRLLINWEFMAQALAAAFAFGALFAYVSGSSFILINKMGCSPQLFGWIFAIAAIGYVLGAALNGRLVSLYGVQRMGCIGINVLLSSTVLMLLLSYLFSRSWMSVVLSQLLCEVGISIVIATSVSRALQPIPDLAGAGSALIGFFRFLCAMIASVCVALFASAISLSITILVFSILSWSCLNIQKFKVFEGLLFSSRSSNFPS